MTQSPPPIKDLLGKDMSPVVEKKGKFSYVSWSNMVSEIKKIYPFSYWTQTKFIKQGSETQGPVFPYLMDESGSYVELTFYLEPGSPGQSLMMPILDGANKPIMKPNSFQINTQAMRALAKLVSMTSGLGLYIYSGEDLPPDPDLDEKKRLGDEIKVLGSKKGLSPKMIQEKMVSAYGKSSVSSMSIEELKELRDKIKENGA